MRSVTNYIVVLKIIDLYSWYIKYHSCLFFNPATCIVSFKIVGTLHCFLSPSQCWCARFGELTTINNIGRIRRWATTKKKTVGWNLVSLAAVFGMSRNALKERCVTSKGGTLGGGSVPTIFFWDCSSSTMEWNLFRLPKNNSWGLPPCKNSLRQKCSWDTSIACEQRWDSLRFPERHCVSCYWRREDLCFS